MLKVIVAVFFLSLSSAGHAGCEGMIEKLNKVLGYPNNETAEERSFADCKVWRADPSKSIVALAHFQERSTSLPPGNGLYDLDVLIVKTDTGEILHRLLQKGALPSDANALDSINVDTAQYWLVQGMRAFGIRAGFSHSGGTNIRYQTITLYLIQEHKLKQILGNLIMINNNSEQFRNCFNAFEIKRVLVIANTRNHGFADLILHEKKINRKAKMVNDDCVEIVMPSSRRYTLRYDGESYVIPKELQY